MILTNRDDKESDYTDGRGTVYTWTPGSGGTGHSYPGSCAGIDILLFQMKSEERMYFIYLAVTCGKVM